MVIIDTVINILLGRLTLDPAGMHCPSWDDDFVSSFLCGLQFGTLKIYFFQHLFSFSLKTLKNSCTFSPSPPYMLQGSCAGLEFKTSLEKSLNFRKLKKALNYFGKRVEGLEKFGICLLRKFQQDLVTV